MTAGTAARERQPAGWIVPALAWLLCAGYAAAFLGRDWYPIDEGTLGQTAERVLRGELPHRDFADVYTGGLAFLHAAVFAAAGPDLLALRRLLFVCFLAWIPALYYLASRLARPAAAGGLVLLATAWSYPNYPAAT